MKIALKVLATYLGSKEVFYYRSIARGVTSRYRHIGLTGDGQVIIRRVSSESTSESDGVTLMVSPYNIVIQKYD